VREEEGIRVLEKVDASVKQVAGEYSAPGSGTTEESAYTRWCVPWSVARGFIAPEAVVGWWIEVVFLDLLLSVSRPGGPAPTSEDAA